MKRVFFIDKLIRSEHGHYLEYARRLGAAFREKGYEPVYIGNTQFSGPKSPDLVTAIDFDFERLVLGIDRNALAKKAKEKRKEEARGRRAWRRKLSSLNLIWGSILLLGRDNSGRTINRREILVGILLQLGRLAFKLALGAFVVIPLAFWRLAQRLLPITRPRMEPRLRLRDRGRRLLQRVFDFAERRLELIPVLRSLQALIFVRYRNLTAVDLQARSITKALKKLRLSDDDIVFWPTLKEADLDVVAAVAEMLPQATGRSWHMIFREPVYLHEGADLAVSSQQRSFRDRILRVDGLLDGRGCWWTDTEELAAQYKHMSGVGFGALPVIVPSSLASIHERRSRAKTDPIRLGYFGDARPEKGFGELTHVVEQLAGRRAHRILTFRLTARLEQELEALEGGPILAPSYRERRYQRLQRRVRLAKLKRAMEEVSAPSRLEDVPPVSLQAQANFNVPDGVALTRATRYKLQAQDDLGVRLFLHGLSPAEYLDQFATVDISLLCYVHPLYGAGSSGVFSESVAAGLPVIVTDSTWGGRMLRTDPVYRDHLSNVLAKHGEPLTTDFAWGVENAGSWWSLPYRKFTHIGVCADFDEPSVFDQLKLEFGFLLANGQRVTRTRLLCGKSGSAAAVVNVPPSARLCRMAISRLDSRLSTDNWTVRAYGLDQNRVDGPLQAAGVIVDSAEELVDGVIEIARHIDHYSQTARQMSQRWIEHHTPQSAVEIVVARDAELAPPV
jgi:glycosyltransferase involved in cell wall biosynthesis